MGQFDPASYRFSVAPMLDYTDRHFRLMMRQISRRSLLYTEMVVAQALHHARRERGSSQPDGRLERLLGFDPAEKPLALQVGGDSPALLAEAAQLAADWGYDEINLNVGCPSEKVQKGRFGACLMADPDQVSRCVAAMAAASPLPVTVKHRIGIDEHDSYAELLTFVDALAAAGACRFAVHARKAWLAGLDPKQNRTIPPLRPEVVRQLKRDRPSLTIELNGGLTNLESCLDQLQQVDGVMVGRAAYGHPLQWVEVDRRVFADHSQPRATASSVVRGLIPHAERWRQRGNRLWPIARHLVHLVEGMEGARRWRHGLTQAAGCRDAEPGVLDAAARTLEERGC
ncbi:MAG: tRNA dihydrouridine(20/20a) synthase DusA [Synechococcus sp.]|nr:tRNA dihydrouridine(20/20a) synthase DusA [Synechococcus sp.]